MKFTIKSTWADYLTHIGMDADKFKGLDAEAQADHFNSFNKGMKEAQAEAIENKASKEDLQALQNKIAENQEKQFNALNEALKAINLKVVKGAKGGDKSFKSELAESLGKVKETLAEIKNDDSGKKVSFTVKSAGTMTITGNVSGGNVPVEDREVGLNVIASRRVRLLDVMSQRATQSNVISWVYQANKDGSAGQTAEGSAKNQIDFDLVVASENIKKTTAFIKVSTEMLDDVDFIQSEIEAELMRELLKKVEAGAYNGNGSGNNLNGVYTVATAFTGVGFPTVDNPNIVDVLNASINQIELAEQETPNFAFLNPSVVNGLLAEKVSSSDKRYNEYLTNIGGSLVLNGTTRIIKTTLVGADEFLIGDFNKAMLVTRDGVKFDIGLDGNDLTTNTRTIVAEWRGAVVVKNNDRTAFVKGTISTAKALIETT